MNGLLPLIVVGIGVAVASVTDVCRFKVYNALTFPVFFGGVAYGAIQGGWPGLGFALAGAFAGFGILLVPYLMGGLGAGDVKFVMAMGTWIGAAFLLPAILVGCLVVFVYYFLFIARRHGFSGVVENVRLMVMRLSCFGRNLALNDQYESVQSASRSGESDNHGRLIPFSATMSVGILIVIIIEKLLV
ncbi:MAG: A24 family peptidase [Pirellulaceae bacterium]